MAKNRMTFEKHQRDARKKRKAEEKREAKRRKKELARSGTGVAETEVSEDISSPESEEDSADQSDSE